MVSSSSMVRTKQRGPPRPLARFEPKVSKAAILKGFRRDCDRNFLRIGGGPPLEDSLFGRKGHAVRLPHHRPLSLRSPCCSGRLTLPMPVKPPRDQRQTSKAFSHRS
jgi:hypothetical protein